MRPSRAGFASRPPRCAVASTSDFWARAAAPASQPANLQRLSPADRPQRALRHFI